MSSSYGTANRGQASYTSTGQRLCCACHKNKVKPPAKKCGACKRQTRTARGTAGAGSTSHRSSGRAGRSTYAAGGSTISVSPSYFEDLRTTREAQARAAGLPASRDDMYLWLSAWLEMPGHSVHLLRQITAPTARDWFTARPGATYTDMARHILACECELNQTRGGVQ